jgi:simple sugar transport system permease protein
MAVSVRLERRANLPLPQRIVVLSLAVVLGAVAGALLVQASGYSAVKAFTAILEGSFGGSYPISQTLAAAIPLVTIALGTAVAFRVQLWNIGGEGQFYMGAFGATGVELIGGPAGWPALILLPAMLVAGFAAGAAWALVPAWLRAWHGVNEIITTLMLNYVAVLWVNYLVYGPWKDPAGRNFPFTPRFPDNATFARMGDGQLHTGLFVPIAAAIVLLLVLARTRWGYELRVVGENAEAARYAGINVRSTMLSAMLVSGGMAGVAGMVQVAGIIHLLNGQLSANYGYTAIIIAWLARLHPLAVLVVGVLFGALVNGGYAVSQEGIPQALGAVLQGMILFFVLGIGDLFTRYRVRIVSAPAAAPSTAATTTTTAS